MGEVRYVLACVSPAEAESFIKELERANRIFCFGAGRSGFVLRTFCMRLMQLGFTVYYVGETITPRIQPGDLLIAVSGSGETGHTCGLIKQAHNRQARTVALTAHRHSPIGQLADLTLVIPGTTKLTLAKEETRTNARAVFLNRLPSCFSKRWSCSSFTCGWAATRNRCWPGMLIWSDQFRFRNFFRLP